MLPFVIAAAGAGVAYGGFKAGQAADDAGRAADKVGRAADAANDCFRAAEIAAENFGDLAVEAKGQVHNIGEAFHQQVNQNGDALYQFIQGAGGEIRMQIQRNGEQIHQQVFENGQEFKRQIRNNGDEIRRLIRDANLHMSDVARATTDSLERTVDIIDINAGDLTREVKHQLRTVVDELTQNAGSLTREANTSLRTITAALNSNVSLLRTEALSEIKSLVSNINENHTRLTGSLQRELNIVISSINAELNSLLKQVSKEVGDTADAARFVLNSVGIECVQGIRSVTGMVNKEGEVISYAITGNMATLTRSGNEVIQETARAVNHVDESIGEVEREVTILLDAVNGKACYVGDELAETIRSNGVTLERTVEGIGHITEQNIDALITKLKQEIGHTGGATENLVYRASSDAHQLMMEVRDTGVAVFKQAGNNADRLTDQLGRGITETLDSISITANNEIRFLCRSADNSLYELTSGANQVLRETHSQISSTGGEVRAQVRNLAQGVLRGSSGLMNLGHKLTNHYVDLGDSLDRNFSRAVDAVEKSATVLDKGVVEIGKSLQSHNPDISDLLKSTTSVLFYCKIVAILGGITMIIPLFTNLISVTEEGHDDSVVGYNFYFLCSLTILPMVTLGYYVNSVMGKYNDALNSEKNAKETLGQSIDSLREEVRQLNDSAGSFITFSHMREKFAEYERRQEERLSEVNRQIEGAIDDLKQTGESLSDQGLLVNSVGQRIETLEASQKRLADSLPERLKENGDHCESLVMAQAERIGGRVEGLETKLDALTNNLGHVEQKAAENLAREVESITESQRAEFKSLSDRIEGEVATRSENLGQVSAAIGGSLEKIQADVDTQMERLGTECHGSLVEAKERYDRSIADVNARIENEEDNRAAQFDELKENIDGLKTDFFAHRQHVALVCAELKRRSEGGGQGNIEAEVRALNPS